MERSDLSATNWVMSRFTVAMLALLGFLVLLEPAWLVEAAGSVQRLHGWALFGAFLLLASLSWEKYRLRVEMAELLDGLRRIPGVAEDTTQRDAIDILLRALEGKDAEARRAAHDNLVRLTGQKFAPEPEVWRAWWDANRRSWTARRTEPPQG